MISQITSNPGSRLLGSDRVIEKSIGARLLDTAARIKVFFAQLFFRLRLPRGTLEEEIHVTERRVGEGRQEEMISSIGRPRLLGAAEMTVRLVLQDMKKCEQAIQSFENGQGPQDFHEITELDLSILRKNMDLNIPIELKLLAQADINRVECLQKLYRFILLFDEIKYEFNIKTKDPKARSNDFYQLLNKLRDAYNNAWIFGETKTPPDQFIQTNMRKFQEFTKELEKETFNQAKSEKEFVALETEAKGCLAMSQAPYFKKALSLEQELSNEFDSSMYKLRIKDAIKNIENYNGKGDEFSKRLLGYRKELQTRLEDVNMAEKTRIKEAFFNHVSQETKKLHQQALAHIEFFQQQKNPVPENPEIKLHVAHARKVLGGLLIFKDGNTVFKEKTIIFDETAARTLISLVRPYLESELRMLGPDGQEFLVRNRLIADLNAYAKICPVSQASQLIPIPEISNIDRVTIVESRKFSRGPNSISLGRSEGRPSTETVILDPVKQSTIVGLRSEEAKKGKAFLPRAKTGLRNKRDALALKLNPPSIERPSIAPSDRQSVPWKSSSTVAVEQMVSNLLVAVKNDRDTLRTQKENNAALKYRQNGAMLRDTLKEIDKVENKKKHSRKTNRIYTAVGMKR